MSKSLVAKILEAVLRATKLKYMDSKEEIEKFIENPPKNKVPKRFFKSRDMGGCEVFTFGDEMLKTQYYIFMAELMYLK